MIFRFLTSGESHGKGLNVIIDGMPSGINFDENFINSELKRRQKGYGRGGRMKIEADTVEVLSGVRFSQTLGSPISLFIKNKDFENWQTVMSAIEPEKTSENEEKIKEKTIYNVRPGHADFAGALKYNHEDIRNILERSSARETASRVAAGAVAKLLLREFNIEGVSFVTQIGKTKVETDLNPFEHKQNIENSEFHIIDTSFEEKLKSEIDEAQKDGDTLGGNIEIRFKNLPVGLGSHTQWDKRLDGLIAQAVMSIPAIKSVEIGLGKDCAQISGSKTHDEIFINDGKFIRKTNNAGGLEGGMTNGEELTVKATMKAIPTMRTPLNSVSLKDKTEISAHFERSDTCAVCACAVVAEAMVAIILADAMCEKFTHDNLEDMKNCYNNYLKRTEG
ncbi:chorismate synthase [bacterium]|nr:chorismate synthase [bacterium]